MALGPKYHRTGPDSNDVDMISEYYDFRYGFGYDELHDDYKVVELRNRRAPGVRETQVKNFSLRTNSWKVLSSNWPGGDTFGETGTFLNGAIHWSVCDFNKPVEWVIVSQDLATYTFTELSVPKLDDYYVTLEVRILQGCLALYREHTVYMDVWVMKEYGVNESWNKVFRIPIPPDFSDIHGFVRPRPLYLWADGNILMDYGSSLKMYDSTNPRPHQFDSDSVLSAITYVESIVPLTFDEEEFNNL
ncbi:hypothetical protein OROMI_002296 [Orobanche minor]